MTSKETAGREGKGDDGRAHTREVKLGVFFTQDKLDKDRYPVRDPASTSVIATFEPAPVFADLVKADGIRRGADHVRQLTILGDGAAWIWGIATAKFPGATQVVDLFHAREHLHDLARKLEFMLLDRKDEWLAARLEDLDYGYIDGRKIGRPGFRSRRGRQSVRLTRNGFALHGERLYVSKVGDIRVKWSRPLPSIPSSVTVIREADGRYYASFVVKRDATPLPANNREVGIDVGLARLAVTPDGQVIANPRFLRAKERRLSRAQRTLTRRQKGSANREKARRRVAVLHREVRETRLDHAHKTALRLVRDNQAIYAEGIAVSGLARTRLAKSVHDAGWGQFLRLVEEKAAQYGREFRRIGRLEPTSQVCSACEVRDGPKPLHVRSWTCAACGVTHDRDVNAARNVLALGRRESVNARGGQVRPAPVPAPAHEAGTPRSVA